MVTLLSQEIGKIQDFKHLNGNTYVSLSLFTEFPDEVLSVSHIKKVVRTNTLKTVPIEFIDKNGYRASGVRYRFYVRM